MVILGLYNVVPSVTCSLALAHILALKNKISICEWERTNGRVAELNGSFYTAYVSRATIQSYND